MNRIGWRTQRWTAAASREISIPCRRRARARATTHGEDEVPVDEVRPAAARGPAAAVRAGRECRRRRAHLPRRLRLGRRRRCRCRGGGCGVPLPPRASYRARHCATDPLLASNRTRARGRVKVKEVARRRSSNGGRRRWRRRPCTRQDSAQQVSPPRSIDSQAPSSEACCCCWWCVPGGGTATARRLGSK